MFSSCSISSRRVGIITRGLSGSMRRPETYSGCCAVLRRAVWGPAPPPQHRAQLLAELAQFILTGPVGTKLARPCP